MNYNKGRILCYYLNWKASRPTHRIFLLINELNSLWSVISVSDCAHILYSVLRSLQSKRRFSLCLLHVLCYATSFPLFVYFVMCLLCSCCQAMCVLSLSRDSALSCPLPLPRLFLPHLFPIITLIVCLICSFCVLLIPLVCFTCVLSLFPLLY